MRRRPKAPRSPAAGSAARRGVARAKSAPAPAGAAPDEAAARVPPGAEGGPGLGSAAAPSAKGGDRARRSLASQQTLRSWLKRAPGPASSSAAAPVLDAAESRGC